MKQGLAFICSKTRPGVLERFLGEKGGQFEIVLVDSDNVGKFNKFNIKSLKPYQEQVQRENNYWDIAMEWMDEWNRGTQFYKRVMYQGFSWWWFVRFNFYLWLQGVLPDIDAVKEVLAETKPEQVLLMEIDDYWRDIIQCVASHFNINVSLIERKNTFAHHITLVEKAVPLLIVTGLRVILGMFCILRSRFEGKDEKQAKILMFTHSISWQKLKIGQGDKPRYFDAQLGLVLQELLRRGVKVVALDVMTHPKAGFRAFLQKKYPYIPLEGYALYFFGALKKARQERRKVISVWEDINKEPNFGQGNFYKDIDIAIMARKRLNTVITGSIRRYMYVMGVELFKSILNREKPDVVVVTDENGSGRPLVAAARILGIPAVGFQHGIITDRHVGYVYPKDVDRATIPLCHKTAVFGAFYKEILTKCSLYKESEVEVIGQSRLDLLTQKRFSDVGGISTLPNFPGGKRILLFTSQPGLGQSAAPLLMEGLTRLGDDYFLIIKLHPNESYPAISYEEAAREYGAKNFVIVKQVDLYELIAICDLHISVHSTVLSEAVVFGKPNLVLSMPGSHDVGRWVEQGVALNVSDFANFKEAVETVLKNEETRERLQKAREQFIQKHYYRLDGKATERACNLILSQIKHK